MVRVHACLVAAGVACLCAGLWPTPVEARVMFESGISAREIYTDNLLFTQTDKRDDFGTFISPKAQLTYQSKNITFGGRYTGVLQLFANNPDQNTYAQNANLIFDLPGLTQRYKGLEIELIESFNFTPQVNAFAFGGEPGESPLPPAQPTSQPGAAKVSPQVATGGAIPGLGNQGITTTRAKAFQNLAGFRLRYDWTPRLSPSLVYQNRLLLFASDAFQDSMVNAGNFALNYQWRRGTSYRIAYGIQYTDFISGGAFGSADNFFSHRGTVGLSHRVSRTLAFTGDVGASVTRSILNFNGNLRLVKDYQRGTLSLRLSQNITPGGGLTTSATLSQNLVGSINHRFTQRLSGFLQGGIARNDSLEGNQIDAWTYQAGAGLNVNVLRWLQANLGYNFLTQDNKGTLAADAQRNFVFLGLTATALPWKIFD